jgi:hypothetical protein
MLYREIVTVYSEKQENQKSTVYGKNSVSNIKQVLHIITAMD